MAAGGGEIQARMEHLSGLRCLLAFWVVCGHYAPRGPPSAFSAGACRSFMAVDVFVVMSGFVTHWSYGPRLCCGSLSLRQFYVRRLANVILTTYCAMISSLLVVLAVPELRAKLTPSAWTIAGCLGFVVHWVDPEAWCPAPPSWTVEALLPSWLLYPLTREALARVEARGGGVGLVAVAVALWVVSFGPIVVIFAAQGFHLTWAQYATDFLWPPAQLADFMIGAAAAAIALRHNSNGGEEDDIDGKALQKLSCCSRAWPAARALMADAAFVAMVATVLLAPPPKTHAECQTDWNALLSHEWALAIAIFLYGSAPAGYGGLAARLLGHKALAALGTYSFEVYLFQWTLVAIFHAAVGQWPLSSEVFMAFLLTLWLVSGLYVEWVGAPLTCALRNAFPT